MQVKLKFRNYSDMLKDLHTSPVLPRYSFHSSVRCPHCMKQTTTCRWAQSHINWIAEEIYETPLILNLNPLLYFCVLLIQYKLIPALSSITTVTLSTSMTFFLIYSDTRDF